MLALPVFHVCVGQVFDSFESFDRGIYEKYYRGDEELQTVHVSYEGQCNQHVLHGQFLLFVCLAPSHCAVVDPPCPYRPCGHTSVHSSSVRRWRSL